MGSQMNWADLVGNVGTDQYTQRIEGLKKIGLDTRAIEDSVNATINNLNKGDVWWFPCARLGQGKICFNSEMSLIVQSGLRDFSACKWPMP